MHAVIVEWRSVGETGADELDKQLTVGENHDCSSLHKTLLQNKLMIEVCSILLNVVEESNRNVVVEVDRNNRNVVAVVEENNRNVVVVKESNRNVVVLVDKKNNSNMVVVVVVVGENNRNVVVLGEKKL